jgi:uncharacterized repeat protein (TIGR03803 family)
VLANAATFTMPVSVASGAPYNITVPTNPAALNCTVANGSGTVSGANVTNVSINCATGTESILYAFGGPPHDAVLPQYDNSLIQPSNGYFYGLTYYGGDANGGAVVQLTSGGTESVLYSFGGPQIYGGVPTGSLIQGSDGLLYGMTNGSVFSMTLTGTPTTVHDFAGTPADGSAPYGSLIQATDGFLYGTTSGGGTNNRGTVFKVNATGTEFSILYSFTEGADGGLPYAGLVQASDGNLYGTTYFGGAYNSGTLFRVNLQSSPVTVTTLHSFGAPGDGVNVEGALIQASDGNLYGMTSNGGNVSTCSNCGTVYEYELTSNPQQERVVYSFRGGPGDGSVPYFGHLIQGNDGNLYGLTAEGGTNNAGTLFEITLDGVETVLWSFGGSSSDGAYPQGSLIQGADGSLYGMTSSAGANNDGVVFRFN